MQRPVVHEFRVAVGRCTQCHRRVQGRHPLQTSDALGAAAVQLGPQAVALAVILNKQLGLSFGKIAQLLRDRFGLTLTRGGLVLASVPRSCAALTALNSSLRYFGRRGRLSQTPFNQLRYTDPLNRDELFTK